MGTRRNVCEWPEKCPYNQQKRSRSVARDLLRYGRREARSRTDTGGTTDQSPLHIHQLCSWMSEPMHHSSTVWHPSYAAVCAGMVALGMAFPATNVWGQNPGNPGNPAGVQNRAPGYGAGGNATQTIPVAANPSAEAPNKASNAANPSFNPQLNAPANANANAQSLIEQAVRDGRQWQMQGPNNGGQVIAEPPFPPLTPQEQQYIDQILTVWEEKTANIERFSSDFMRWEYDSQAPGVAELSKQLGQSDIPIAAGQGVIRFQKPDKGLFRTDEYAKSTGRITANRQVELIKDNQNFGEYVICDGKNVWDYDRKEKICTRMELPPEMQGLGIMNSPLPFLFGVKAEEIKARYWVRAISPGMQDGKPVQDKYAVEAYPKYPVDAVNYHHVQIVLDRDQFLPVLMVLYMPEWNDKGSSENGVVIEPRDKRMVYQFSNRQSNANIFQKISEAIFQKEFIPTEPPADWKKNEIPYLPPANSPPAGNGQRTANPTLPTNPNNPRPR